MSRTGPRARAPVQLALEGAPLPLERTAWLGPFQPVLESAWLSALPRLSGSDPLAAVWLLVPSRFLGRHLVRLAAHAGGIVNLHVLTFTDLADRILRAGGGVPPGDHAPGSPARRRRLPRVGDVLLLRQALRDAVPDDGYFGTVREARRFPAVLAATLAELRTAGVGPADLERAAESAPSPASAVKLREVARIARHADAALGAAGFEHPTDALWAAALRAEADPALATPCAGLAVYGFTEWNAAERALLSVVFPRVPIACFLPAEAGPPFAPLEALTTWLAARGFRIEPAPVGERRGPRALAARLFHPPVPPGAGAAGLEVVAAPGEEREVREIARRLLAAAADGIPFEAMGILLRRPDAYRDAIGDVLGAAGIPYTWGVAPGLGDTRAGRSLRLLLACRQEDFARGAVLEFLAAADLRQADGTPAAEWDRLSREAGIVGGRADWRRGLGRLAGRAARQTAPPGAVELDDEGRRTAAPPDAAAIMALGRVVRVLLDTAGALPEVAPAAGFARALWRAYRRLCRRDDESEEVGALLAGLQDLAPLATPLSLDEFGDLLDQALALPREPAPETRQGKVFVGELHQALGLPFRVLVIPGLVEQGFPAPPRSDPVLLDEERRLLWAQSAGGRPGLALAARRLEEERLAFRLVAAAAEERLILTYPRVEPQSGRARVPSFFLLRVAEAATGLAYDFSRLEQDFAPHVRVPLVPAPPGVLGAPVDRREWLLAQATKARGAGAAARAACLAQVPRAARGRTALEAREQGGRVSAWDGLLPADLRPALAAHHRPTDAPVAATPLETYATCPFRYYLAHVLRVAPPVEPERVLTIAPIDRGRLLHAVLAEAYAAFRDAGLLPLTPERVPAARALLEAAFARAEGRVGPTGLDPFWRGERARLLADLAAALEAEAGEASGEEAWIPTAFEVAFGAGEAAPAVTLDLESGRRLAFRGRLDRLDLSPDGTRARVIDYKSGRSPAGSGARLAGGTALQLPVYRLAAEALCRAGGRPATVGEAQYYFLTRRGRRRRLAFTETDWSARRADFERALETVLDGIAAGRFFQNPSPETCRWCDYQAACGAERERIAWASEKLTDPVRGPYARLQEIE